MGNLALFGEFNSDNLGDVLLGVSQKDLYEQKGYEVTLKTLEGEGVRVLKRKDKVLSEKRFSLIHELHRYLYSLSIVYRHYIELLIFLFSKKKLQDKFEVTLKGFDKAIVGGGQLFSDNSLRMLLHIYIITKTAKKLRIKKCICGSGVPEPKTFISKILMKKIFMHYKAEDIFIRDEKSKEVINRVANIGLDNSNIIPDFVLSYLRKYEGSKTESNLIGLAPISFDCLSAKQKKYSYNQDQWWVDFAKYIKESGYTPVLFCHGAITDYERCKKIKKLAYAQGIKLELNSRPVQVQSYIDMVKSFRNVLGQRLHVSIAAFSLKLSPVSLPWDDKVKCFYNSAGLESNFIASEFSNYEMVLRLLLNEVDTEEALEALSLQTNKVLSQVLYG